MAGKPGIALQLYTVRDDLSRDLDGTLRAIADMGYTAVQVSGFGPDDGRSLRRKLDGMGLSVAGAHISLERLETDLEAEIEFVRAIGTRDVVCPWVSPERRGDARAWRGIARSLELIGKRCDAAGARFSYHNHDFELERVNGTTALDILLGETDPKHVFFEPDVYWLAIGGADPAEVVRRYAGRCPLVHLKDAAPDARRSFAEVGEGTLDFGPIFAASEAGGAEWYIVEQDTCARPPLESAKISLDHLREWGKA